MTDRSEVTQIEEYDFANCRTRRNRNGPYYMPDVVAAILKTNGNFAQMSLLLGRRRQQVRDYVYANIETMDLIQEVRESILDEAEATLQRLALQGDGPSLRFLLQTLGKDRGYTTRVEQTGPGGGPVESRVTIDPSKLSTEELRALRNAIQQGDGQ